MIIRKTRNTQQQTHQTTLESIKAPSHRETEPKDIYEIYRQDIGKKNFLTSQEQWTLGETIVNYKKRLNQDPLLAETANWMEKLHLPNLRQLAHSFLNARHPQEKVRLSKELLKKAEPLVEEIELKWPQKMTFTFSDLSKQAKKTLMNADSENLGPANKLAKAILKFVKNPEINQLLNKIEQVTAAQNTLVETNLPIGINFAKRFMNRGVPFMDLIQEANIGLMRGTNTYDPQTGNRFLTHAHWFAFQRPQRAVEKEAALQKGQKLALTVKLNRPKGAQATAAEIENNCTSTETPYEIAAAKDELKAVRALIEHLEPREKVILQMRFGLADGEPHTLKEIGDSMDLTRERVRQIEAEALDKLRAIFLAKENNGQRVTLKA